MPSSERGHGGVAGERSLVDVRRVDPTLAADLLGQGGQRLGGGHLQAAERGGVEHRRADPRDHVGAERLLLVEHRRDADGGAGDEVEQGGHDRRGAEVERDRVADRGGVAGLDVDERLVDDHRRHLEVRLAEHLRQPTQGVEVGDRLEVVDGVEQPGQVGPLVLERGLGQLDVPLLDRGPQDDLPAHADGGGLRAGDQGRYDDVVVAGRLDQAGQPPAAVELAGAERTCVVPGHRRGRRDPHLALVAGAVATAGGVDRDAVPRCGVEDADTWRHPYLAVGRRRLLVLHRERQLDAAGAVVGGRLGARWSHQPLAPDLLQGEGLLVLRGQAHASSGSLGIGGGGAERGRPRLRGVFMRWQPAWPGERRSRPSPSRRG